MTQAADISAPAPVSHDGTGLATSELPGEQVRLAIVQCNDLHIGIPIQNLAEVARVDRIHPVAQKTAGMIGVFRLRKLTIPVYDLWPRTEPTGNEEGGNRLLAVLRVQSRYAGFLIDAVHGMRTVPATRIQKLESVRDASPAPESTEMTHLSGVLLDNERTISVFCPTTFLDREEIVSLTASMQERGREESSSGALHGELNLQRSLVFVAGGVQYGIPATGIYSTVPRTRIRANALTSEICHGSIEHGRRKVPILRTEAVIGLGHRDPEPEVEIILLKLPCQSLVGLAADRIERMLGINYERLSPLSGANRMGLDLLEGTLCEDDTEDQIFVISPEAIARNSRIQRLAAACKSTHDTDAKGSPSDASDPAGTPSDGTRYLVFECGAHLATAAEDVLRIIKAPQNFARCGEEAGTGIRGYFRYGKRSAMHIDLPALLNLPPGARQPDLMLMVESEGECFGFSVGNIVGIETSRWSTRQEHDGIADKVVQLGKGKNRRIVPVVDLPAIARKVVT